MTPSDAVPSSADADVPVDVQADVDAGLVASSDPSMLTDLNAFSDRYVARDFSAAVALGRSLFSRGCADPGFCVAFSTLLLHAVEDPAAARTAVERALLADAEGAAAWAMLASIERYVGAREQAAAAARKAFALGAAHLGVRETALTILAEVSPADDPATAAAILDMLGADALPAANRRQLHGVLGRILDRMGLYEQAFAQFAAANALSREVYPADAETAALAASVETMTDAFFAARAGYGAADRRPLFIVGLPRTGSSLLEQLLSRHPDVTGCGERAAAPVALGASPTNLSPDLVRGLVEWTPADAVAAAERYLAEVRPFAPQPDAARWIDKMPGNFRFVGPIHLMFPNATIVHIQRDLRDVALSCFKLQFAEGHAYADDLSSLAHMMIVYQETMAHWARVLPDRVVSVRYEELAVDPEPSLRRVLAAAGLDWDPACAAVDAPASDVGRLVRTASSSQVRERVHSGSIGLWRNYETELRPLIEILEQYRAAAEPVAA